MQDKGSPQKEVPVVDDEVVQCVRAFSRLGWSSRQIAAELGIARQTVRRYIRGPAVAAGVQARPKRRRLNDAYTERAAQLWAKEAAGNAVVVQRLLCNEGATVSLRTVQRLVAPGRAAKALKDLATVRFETPPGVQMQIDFGQKKVTIAGEKRKVFFFVAVLGFSRRIFVMATLSERQEDWQEGVVKAFHHFGGSTQTILIDNPKAIVLSHVRDADTRTVTLHPAFAAFCKDWGITAKACAPYRARTKGKVENAVGYVKHNAVAELDFICFGALQAHLEVWMTIADGRLHGTLKKRPIDVFNTEEAEALAPLPQRPMPARTRRIKRKVANDCFVNIDTIRYSVPHKYVGCSVMVEVGETNVRIFDGVDCIAVHDRCRQAHKRVVIQGHFAGLLRAIDVDRNVAVLTQTAAEGVDNGAEQMANMGRTLDVYAAVVEGASL